MPAPAPTCPDVVNGINDGVIAAAQRERPGIHFSTLQLNMPAPRAAAPAAEHAAGKGEPVFASMAAHATHVKAHTAPVTAPVVEDRLPAAAVMLLHTTRAAASSAPNTDSVSHVCPPTNPTIQPEELVYTTSPPSESDSDAALKQLADMDVDVRSAALPLKQNWHPKREPQVDASADQAAAAEERRRTLCCAPIQPGRVDCVLPEAAAASPPQPAGSSDTPSPHLRTLPVDTPAVPIEQPALSGTGSCATPVTAGSQAPSPAHYHSAAQLDVRQRRPTRIVAYSPPAPAEPPVPLLHLSRIATAGEPAPPYGASLARDAASYVGDSASATRALPLACTPAAATGNNPYAEVPSDARASGEAAAGSQAASTDGRARIMVTHTPQPATCRAATYTAAAATRASSCGSVGASCSPVTVIVHSLPETPATQRTNRASPATSAAGLTERFLAAEASPKGHVDPFCPEDRPTVLRRSPALSMPPSLRHSSPASPHLLLSHESHRREGGSRDSQRAAGRRSHARSASVAAPHLPSQTPPVAATPELHAATTPDVLHITPSSFLDVSSHPSTVQSASSAPPSSDACADSHLTPSLRMTPSSLRSLPDRSTCSPAQPSQHAQPLSSSNVKNMRSARPQQNSAPYLPTFSPPAASTSSASAAAQSNTPLRAVDSQAARPSTDVPSSAAASAAMTPALRGFNSAAAGASSAAASSAGVKLLNSKYAVDKAALSRPQSLEGPGYTACARM